MTIFYRLVDVPVESKPAALLAAVGGRAPEDTFSCPLERLAQLPGCPFAYWMSDGALNLFRTAPALRTNERFARVGMGTLDNFQFLRLWYETSSTSSWVPYANGGRLVRFMFDSSLVVNWSNEGRVIKVFVEQRVGSASRKVQSEALFFREGMTWPLRASKFCPQILPAGCIFSARGQTLFAKTRDELLALTALGSSEAFDFLFKVMLGRFGFPEFLAGGLERMPLPKLTTKQTTRFAELARHGWSLCRRDASHDETHRLFVLPRALADTEDFNGTVGAARLLAEIDRAALDVFGLRPEDIAGANDAELGGEDLAEDASADEEADVTAGDAEFLMSWLVGVAFERFDPRLATGERPFPVEPGPFDVLPSRAPGMYPVGEEPGNRPEIFVDDEGHPDDLVTHVRTIADRVHADVPERLRAWIAKEFFPLHIKVYSKNRRRAPIYWQLATPSASYSVWVYIHAFSKDTLFQLQNDYVALKLAHEERRLESLSSELRDGATAAQRKALAAQEALVGELRAFLEEVKRVAPLWNPNLDDGVIINFAPLWRLVPQNKAWQKEAKAMWDSLCAGKHEWAHLAMHLWPERVVPKCAKDRSLAIAHGLEEVFWGEGADGKWSARKTPTRSIAELVRDRTSPAVKEALKSLLEAPSAVGKGARGRTGRRRSVGADRGDA